ncbi:MAG TPA: hypothetical protein VFZ63_06100 [Jiangellaceae bacterium]
MLSSLLVVVSVMAVWAHRTIFETDAFMATVQPALDDPALYVALSDSVSEQALEILDLDTRAANRLSELDEYLATALGAALDLDARVAGVLSRLDRPTLAVLGPPISARLEDRATQVIDELIRSEAFRQRLPVLIRRAHQASVTLVRSDVAGLPNVYVADGAVQLNLIPVIADALRHVEQEIPEFLPDVELPGLVSERAAEGREQLAAALRAQVPEDFGQVRLMSEDSLVVAQQTMHRIDRNVWAVLLITLAVVAAAVALSAARRRTLVQVFLGVVIGVVLAAALVRRLRSSFVDDAAAADGRSAVGIVLNATTSSVYRLALLVGLGALIGALVAYLAGRPAWIERSVKHAARLVDRSWSNGRFNRWVAGRADLLRIATIGAGTAIIVASGLDPVPVVIVALAVGMCVLAISLSARRAGQRAPDDWNPGG